MDNNDYNYVKPLNDECSSRGACAISPALISLQELILYFIKLTAYYILKLEKFNLYNINIKNEIINNIASLIYINEYSEKQLFELAVKNYYIYKKCKERYILECNELGVIPVLAAENGYLNNINLTLSQFISFGDLLLKQTYNSVPFVERNFLQILLIMLKNVCQSLSELFDFEDMQDYGVSEIFRFLHVWDKLISNKSFLLKYINILADLNFKLQLKLADLLIAKYGIIRNVEVSHSTRKGKCILVSGNNFNDLLNILEITKKLDIDVYTHSNLLISHSLSKFSMYAGLRGHYGKSTENCILDYATFPGAILLTKNSKNNTEYLYRGKIFSNDYITPQGVIKIKDNDYTPLIETAINSKGFKKGRILPNSDLGFNLQDVDKLFAKLCEKLEAGSIKRIFIVGANSFSNAQKEYFDVFFENLKYDEYAISFYYASKKSNVVTINIGNYIPLVSYLLNKFLKNNDFIDKVYFMFPVCDGVSISGIIKLKNIGASNIYMSSCSPRIVSPSVFQILKKHYHINVFTGAIADLMQIRKNTSR